MMRSSRVSSEAGEGGEGGEGGEEEGAHAIECCELVCGAVGCVRG